MILSSFSSRGGDIGRRRILIMSLIHLESLQDQPGLDVADSYDATQLLSGFMKSVLNHAAASSKAFCQNIISKKLRHLASADWPSVTRDRRDQTALLCLAWWPCPHRKTGHA
jgi:hypothetical protein